RHDPRPARRAPHGGVHQLGSAEAGYQPVGAAAGDRDPGVRRAVTPRRVLLATWNPAKQDCLRGLLYNLPVDILTPDSVGLSRSDVDESGSDYLQNAETKALAFARAANMPA